MLQYFVLHMHRLSELSVQQKLTVNLVSLDLNAVQSILTVKLVSQEKSSCALKRRLLLEVALMMVKAIAQLALLTRDVVIRI